MPTPGASAALVVTFAALMAPGMRRSRPGAGRTAFAWSPTRIDHGTVHGAPATNALEDWATNRALLLDALPKRCWRRDCRARDRGAGRYDARGRDVDGDPAMAVRHTTLITGASAGLDRVVVNAGLGRGASVGTGYCTANRQTAETNFVAALAQCEAALALFRPRNAGHLVAISSVAGTRGMGRAQTVYAATKAGLTALAEGIRIDLRRTPIRVTTILPGCIDTDLDRGVRNRLFVVDTATGCRALVHAIEREPAHACVPRWPWPLLACLMRHAPRALLARP